MFGFFKKKSQPVEVTPEYATLYLPDPTLLGSTVLDAVPGIKSYEGMSEEGSATGLRLQTKAGEIIMNFMPPDMIEEHLAGMSEFMGQQVRDRSRLPYVLGRIKQMTFVVGCVIPSGIDDKGTIIEVLMRLNHGLNGLFELGESLFDADGQPIAGDACDG